MKQTQYFKYIRKRPDRKIIKLEWIENVISNPIKTNYQSDKRVRKWGYIDEVDKYLRVVLLEDEETVHNAFFDRSFKK